MLPEIQKVVKDPAFAKEFRILGAVGEGGMGMVFKAIQTSLNRTVAVKILLPSLFSDESTVKRLQREAQLTADLRKHENIVRLLTYGQVNEQPYVVYEFVEGESLAAVIAREAPLGLTRAVDLVSQLLLGLEHAHEHRIIHRDIKPDNILLDKFNNLKVMDFGIALGDTGGEKLTKEGLIIGTPVYMAPEQASAKTVSGQADLYAAGVILYEMLTGQIPWDKDTALAILAEKVSGRFIPLHQTSPEIPEPLCALVDRTLSSDPRKRPRSARAFRKELETLASQFSSEISKIANEDLPTNVMAIRQSSATQQIANSTRLPPAPMQTQAVRTGRQEKAPGVLPPAAIVKIAVSSVALAVVALVGLYVWSQQNAARDAQLHFASVAAHFLPPDAIQVSWQYPSAVSPMVVLERSDGGGGTRRAQMSRDAQGHGYEVQFQDVDPYQSYSYNVVLPGLFGSSHASEPRRLDGLKTRAVRLMDLVDRSDLTSLARGVLSDRREGMGPEEATEKLALPLLDLGAALRRFSDFAQLVWAHPALAGASEWRLYDAITQLQALDWQCQALGVELPTPVEGLLPERFAASIEEGGLIPDSACRLTTENGAPAGILLRRSERVRLIGPPRCLPQGQTVATLLLNLRGQESEPYLLLIRVGQAHTLRVLGPERAPSGQLLRQRFPAQALRSGIRLAIELLPMPRVTRSPQAPGIRLQGAALLFN